MRKVTGAVICFCALVLYGCATPHELTCDYPHTADPGVSHQITATGSQIGVTYGVNQTFGMVGTSFALTENSSGKTIELCEARSAAGAGWQHSEIITSYEDNDLIFNQAAGNAVGYQWGYRTTIRRHQKPSLASMKATRWLPCYSDTINGNPVSPCTDGSARFNRCVINVTAASFSIAGRGQCVNLTHKTTYKANISQNWKRHFSMHAYYMKRKEARAADMAIFMKGADGWQAGPIFPCDRWTASDLMDLNGVKRGTYDTPPWGGSWSTINPDVEQITVLVTIGNTRAGWGIKNLPSGLSIRMAETVYGSNPNDDEDGSIDIITFWPPEDHVAWRAGAERSYEQTLCIGTRDQLQALGFWCD
jgi:hypothetical protein